MRTSCVADMHDMHTYTVFLLQVSVILLVVEAIRLVARFVLEKDTRVMLAGSRGP